VLLVGKGQPGGIFDHNYMKGVQVTWQTGLSGYVEVDWPRGCQVVPQWLCTPQVVTDQTENTDTLLQGHSKRSSYL
jgi:hypothetical protein